MLYIYNNYEQNKYIFNTHFRTYIYCTLTFIIFFWLYVIKYQYEAVNKLIGKSKSCTYFLNIFTDSKTYSLQSETNLNYLKFYQIK